MLKEAFTIPMLRLILLMSLAAASHLPLALGQTSDSWADAKIQGTVTNETGTPIAGATVTADDRFRSINRQVTTDTSGHYELSPLAAGHYTVWAEARSYGCILLPHVIVKAGEVKEQNFTFYRSKSRKSCEPAANRTSKP